MSNYYEEAEEKLKRESSGGGFNKYANAMKKAVKEALLDFCRQDEEFAQAVAQGGSFQDCMKAVAQGVTGNSISDLKAYSLAVGFYFPGAEIKMQMRIDLIGSAAKEDKPAPQRAKAKIIDLSDFL